MTKFYACCDECFHILGQKDKSAAQGWLDLCEHYSVLGSEVFPDENLEICLLENMGFIITTDVSNGIRIKLRTALDFNGESFFCSGKCTE